MRLIHDTLSSVETISFGGLAVPGFALGASSAVDKSNVQVTATPVVAALAVGTTVSLFAATLKAPLWGTLLAGSAASLITKVAIDLAGDRAAGGA